MDGWELLAFQMLKLALRDVRQANGHSASAWAFLRSEGAVLCTEALGLDYDYFMRRVQQLSVPEQLLLL